MNDHIYISSKIKCLIRFDFVWPKKTKHRKYNFLLNNDGLDYTFIHTTKHLNLALVKKILKKTVSGIIQPETSTQVKEPLLIPSAHLETYIWWIWSILFEFREVMAVRLGARDRTIICFRFRLKKETMFFVPNVDGTQIKLSVNVHANTIKFLNRRNWIQFFLLMLVE